MDYKEILVNKDENAYGPDYKNHSLEIYKIYIEMADRISTRRQSANAFFLSINTALVAFFSAIKTNNLSNNNAQDFIWMIGIAGILLCYTWYRLIKSYKGMNSGKFKIVHEVEEILPLKPYDAEWEVLSRGKDPKIYHPFTDLEIRIPMIFLFINLAITIISFPYHIFI